MYSYISKAFKTGIIHSA